MKKIFISIICLLILTYHSVSGCNLADHKWKLQFSLENSLSAPLVLIPEINLISSKCLKDSVKQIKWVVDDVSTTLIGNISRMFTTTWPKSIPWNNIEKNKFKLDQCSKDTLVLGSSNVLLKFSLFVDEHSKGRCYELVISHENLTRLVSLSSKKPVAEQFRLQSWVAITFIDLPLPGKFLSITAFPYDGHVTVLYENQKLAENLMDTGFLQRIITSGADCSFE